MKKASVMGRASIFPGKVNDSKHRVQAFLSEIGLAQFEAARARLGALARNILGKAPAVVSDADTIEYLGRGEQKTVRYLEGVKRQQAAAEKK